MGHYCEQQSILASRRSRDIYWSMTKLESIEKAVEALSAEELARFRTWFEEFQERQFDEAIERDAKAGKLDKLAAKAIADDKAGRTSDL